MSHGRRHHSSTILYNKQHHNTLHHQSLKNIKLIQAISIRIDIMNPNKNEYNERHAAMIEFMNCFPTHNNLHSSFTSTTSSSSSFIITNLLELNDGIVLFQALSTM